MTYCKYCFNARIYKPTEEEMMDPYATELTDDNDGASCGVGHCHNKQKRFMINSGMGKPVNIEFEEWDTRFERWCTVGRYYPKYCPECGRKLDEYDLKPCKDCDYGQTRCTKVGITTVCSIDDSIKDPNSTCYRWRCSDDSY